MVASLFALIWPNLGPTLTPGLIAFPPCFPDVVGPKVTCWPGDHAQTQSRAQGIADGTRNSTPSHLEIRGSTAVARLDRGRCRGGGGLRRPRLRRQPNTGF